MTHQGGRKPPLLTRIVGLAKQNPIVALIVLDAIFTKLDDLEENGLPDIQPNAIVSMEGYKAALKELLALVDER
jgi:hypothetical protein